MKKIALLCVSIFIFSILCSICKASDLSQLNIDKVEYGSKIHFGYWNDNFGYERLFWKKTHKRGADDFITSTFFMRGIYSEPKFDLSVDVYLNIVTDKLGGRRVDIFTCRFTKEQKLSLCSIRYGVGIISLGNYGGEIIQNWYHNLTEVRKVDLKYDSGTDNYLHLHTGFVSKEISLNSFNLGFFSLFSYSNPLGMENIKTGITMKRYWGRFSVFRNIETQLLFGYIDRFNLPESLVPMLGSGFTGGGRITIMNFENIIASAWILVNQYGNNQTQVGFSFAIGKNISEYPEFKEILCP